MTKLKQRPLKQSDKAPLLRWNTKNQEPSDQFVLKRTRDVSEKTNRAIFKSVVVNPKLKMTELMSEHVNKRKSSSASAAYGEPYVIVRTRRISA